MKYLFVNSTSDNVTKKKRTSKNKTSQFECPVKILNFSLEIGKKRIFVEINLFGFYSFSFLHRIFPIDPFERLSQKDFTEMTAVDESSRFRSLPPSFLSSSIVNRMGSGDGGTRWNVRPSPPIFYNTDRTILSRAATPTLLTTALLRRLRGRMRGSDGGPEGSSSWCSWLPCSEQGSKKCLAKRIVTGILVTGILARLVYATLKGTN